MTNTTAPAAPADALPLFMAPAPVVVDGALFLPASRHSTLPKGAAFFHPRQAAARHTARALRAQGQTAWAAVHAGVWGVFVALPS